MTRSSRMLQWLLATAGLWAEVGCAAIPAVCEDQFQQPIPASTWYAPDVQAVVILTFDDLGQRETIHRIATALRALEVRATFYARGDAFVGSTALGPGFAEQADWYDAPSGAPGWSRDYGDDVFEIANHTFDHPTIATLRDEATQTAQLSTNHEQLTRPMRATGLFPFGRPVRLDGFRAPGCDSTSSIAPLIDNLLEVRSPTGAPVLRSDSSIPFISRYARFNRLQPLDGSGYTAASDPGALQRSARCNSHPYVFVANAAGETIVEFPYTYATSPTGRAPASDRPDPTLTFPTGAS